jgi:hypothetical protein
MKLLAARLTLLLVAAAAAASDKADLEAALKEGMVKFFERPDENLPLVNFLPEEAKILSGFMHEMLFSNYGPKRNKAERNVICTACIVGLDGIIAALDLFPDFVVKTTLISLCKASNLASDGECSGAVDNYWASTFYNFL